jgi:hypothetical protein
MNEQAKKKRPGPRMEAGSDGARKWAATILQVLAGEWTPGEGAMALGVSMARCYAVELRAIRGLVRGCEPRTGKRRRRPEHELMEMKRHIVRLERDCARKQALLRAAQRTVGIQPPAAKAKDKRHRRPMVRALKMAAVLREPGITAQTGEVGAVK